MLAEFGEIVTKFNCVGKFHCALIMSYSLQQYINNLTAVNSGAATNNGGFILQLLKANIGATRKLLKGFFIPTRHLSDVCSVPIKSSSRHGHYEECVYCLKSLGNDVR